ncbi:LssY C-terminal domain-containing protein [Paraburkholderia sp. SIMBA_030]|uniref:LssY C-terminal domain-containing protein n=1 Tax=Paraburkholderia sp. SIMBA_030 TaxID=3085773 RepID=UPI00397A2AAE
MSGLPPLQRVLKNLAGSVALALIFSSCANWTAPAAIDDAPLRERAVSATKQNTRISVAVLGSDDSKRMFGADLTRSNVQPVWIEVENRSSQALWLLHSGTDPNYFSPLEVAWSMHTLLGRATNDSIDSHLNKLGFRSPVPPGETRTGILFTNLDRQIKLVNVDLLGNRTLIPFSLFLPVPDDVVDPRFTLTPFQYPEAVFTDYRDLVSLRAALERMPCCATDEHATTTADPLNVIVIGTLGDIGAAMVRRSYRRDMRKHDMAQRVFGRMPDVVLRKEAGAGAPSTSLRAWLAPVRFNGDAVYLVQVGRPVGGRFAHLDADGGTLHEDIDEARNFLVQDMMYSGGLAKLGFVYGVGPASQEHPRTTLDGGRYYTDGLRAVMFFATRPLSFSNVDILDWVPYLEQREPTARKESGDAGE